MARKKENKVEEQAQKLKVRLELEAISVNVLANPNNEVEFQKAIKEAFIKQISEKFPFYRYGINTADALTKEEVYIGRIIKDKDKEKYGIITGINAKTINVAYPGGIILQGVPECWLTTEIEDKELEKVIEQFKRHPLLKEVDVKSETSLNIWEEGYTGYFIYNSEIVPVVMGKSPKNRYKFYIINKKQGGYNLEERHLALVCDTREQAEKKLKK